MGEIADDLIDAQMKYPGMDPNDAYMRHINDLIYQPNPPRKSRKEKIQEELARLQPLGNVPATVPEVRPDFLHGHVSKKAFNQARRRKSPEMLLKWYQTLLAEISMDKRQIEKTRKRQKAKTRKLRNRGRKP